MKRRVNISIDERIDELISFYAKKLNTTRSAFIEKLVEKHFEEVGEIW